MKFQDMPRQGKKMQNVSFRSVDELLEYLEGEELKMVEALRATIKQALPNCREKLSYQVPFYKINKNICFIWPGSVYWGEERTYKGVLVGFSYGGLFANQFNYFEKKNRKMVTMKLFEKPEDIDFNILKSYLFEAALFDKQFIQKK